MHIFKKKIAPDSVEKLAWLRLFRTENVGTVTFYELLRTYGGAQEALDALPGIAARGGRKKPLFVPALSLIEKEYAALRLLGGDLVTAQDADYPDSLLTLPDAPPVLSVIGNAALLQRQSVAIVGARNASLNGKKFARDIARDLGAQGRVIVSGLARGIDAAAHEGALPTGTIAVVAGGVDVVYPPENADLQRRIGEGGLIVAECALGMEPFAQSFPRRNRIVSGLSAGVIVVEATVKSGSLITARMAGEQGRDVFAVPGHPLDPRAAGPNHLIREGAILVRHADDVTDHLNVLAQGRMFEDSGRERFQHAPVAVDEKTLDHARDEIMQALSAMPCAVDELIRDTGVTAQQAQIILLELELTGAVQRLSGNRVQLLA